MQFNPSKFSDSLCISIGSSGQEDGRLVTGLATRFNRVVRLRFDDIGTDIETMHAFNQELAREVLDAANSTVKDADVMVHCEGGVSRSVAIGVFLSTLLEKNLVLNAARDYSMVNLFVLQHLKKAYFRERISRLKIPRYDLLALQPQHVAFTSPSTNSAGI